MIAYLGRAEGRQKESLKPFTAVLNHTLATKPMLNCTLQSILSFLLRQGPDLVQHPPLIL
jgi:hypothetical protein